MVFENNGVNVAPPSNGDNTLHMLDKVKLFLTNNNKDQLVVCFFKSLVFQDLMLVV
jgi:hypothetical protein